jgi:hypothetical protein
MRSDDEAIDYLSPHPAAHAKGVQVRIDGLAADAQPHKQNRAPWCGLCCRKDIHPHAERRKEMCDGTTLTNKISKCVLRVSCRNFKPPHLQLASDVRPRIPLVCMGDCCLFFPVKVWTVCDLSQSPSGPSRLLYGCFPDPWLVCRPAAASSPIA